MSGPFSTAVIAGMALSSNSSAMSLWDGLRLSASTGAGGNANTTRGFNRLSQKAKRRRARQKRSQSFKGGAK